MSRYLFALRLVLLVSLLSWAPHAHAQSRVGTSCNYSLSVSTPTLLATSQIIAAPAVSQAIHICSVTLQVQQGQSAVNWGLISGTGSACSVNQQAVTPMFLGTASQQQSIGQLYGANNALNLPAGAALCFALSGAPSGAVALITYALY